MNQQFSEDELQRALTSNNPIVVDQALSFIQGADREFAAATLEQAARLLTHEDPEFRAGAALAVGLHWQLESAYIPILEMVRSENDVGNNFEALTAAVSAATAFGLKDAAKRGEVVKTLCGLALDSARPQIARAMAFLGVRAIVLKLGVAQRSAEWCAAEDTKIDEKWIREIQLRYAS